MKKIEDSFIKIENQKYYVLLYKLYNSYLMLLSDQKEMGIGNVTLSSPSLIKDTKSISSSYRLFGVDNEFLSTAISEKLSNKLDKPILLLTFLRIELKEKQIIKKLLDFLNTIFEEILNKKT